MPVFIIKKKLKEFICFPLAFLLRVRLEEMKCHQLVSTIQQKYKWLLDVLITVRVKSVLGCMVGDIYGTARKRKSCLSWKVSDTCACSSANWYRDSTDNLVDRVKGKEAGKTLIAFPCRANDRCHFFFTPNITIKPALFFRSTAGGIRAGYWHIIEAHWEWLPIKVFWPQLFFPNWG